MPEHRFTTPDPVRLYVEVGRGAVVVAAEPTAETVVTVEGERAEEVVVDHTDDDVSVVAPRSRGLHDARLDVRVVVPAHSDLATRCGSADLHATGPLGEALLRTGSGDLAVEHAGGEVRVETGSGDLGVGTVQGDLVVKSGSGDVGAGRAEADVTVSTGSGDVEVGTVGGTLTVKTGSGDLRATRVEDGLRMHTASGDVVVGSIGPGRVVVRTASGDCALGVPAGLPVWADVTSLTGSVRSGLDEPGTPGDGAPYLDLHVASVSGDVVVHPA